MTSLVDMLRANGSWEADAAAAKITRLEAALAHIYAWYPINVSEPIQTIHEIRNFAREVLSSGPGETPAS